MSRKTGIKIDNDVLSWIQSGNKVRIITHESKENIVYHICAIIDFWYVVVKEWWRRKQRWNYEVVDLYTFQLYYEVGKLELIGKSQERIMVEGGED